MGENDTSITRKAVYTITAVSAFSCFTLLCRRYQRVSNAREQIQALLDPVAGREARIVITGATSGIGLELAQEFHRHPSVFLLLGCRNLAQADRYFKGKERIHVHHLELLDFDSVQGFVEEAHDFLRQGDEGLRLLVNNAGIMPKSTAQTSRFDVAWQTNFLAPFLLTELLARRRMLLSSSQRADVRVVQVSSRLERRSALDLENMEECMVKSSPSSYSDSKRALMLWTSVRAQHLAFKAGLYCHASTPGMVDTQLGRHSVASWVWPWTKPLRMFLLRSPAEGAYSAVAAALKPQATQVFGRYWDGEVQLEDLVMERMGEKRLAQELVKSATSATALEQRADGYER